MWSDVLAMISTARWNCVCCICIDYFIDVFVGVVSRSNIAGNHQ